MFKNLVIKCVYGVARLCFIVLSKHALSLLIKLIFNIMAKEKFNYQIVFSNCGFAQTIVSTGVTEFSAEKILSICTSEVSKITSKDCKVVSFIYQPLKNENYETQKNS